MSKKRVSGAWVDDTPHIYNTSTDTFSTLPHEVIGDGTAISSYTIKGNMTQSGTPTPSNPIYPTECGDKTANLFSGEYSQFDDTGGTGTLYKYFKIEGDFVLYMKAKNNIAVAGAIRYLGLTERGGMPDTDRPDSGVQWLVQSRSNISKGTVLTAKSSNNNFQYISIYDKTLENFNWFIDNFDIMVAMGDSVPAYEPFGYKIPISCNGVTYPIYLSEPIRAKATADVMASTGMVTRAYKKVVLDSNTTIGTYTTQWGIAFVIYTSNVSSGTYSVLIDAVCSHYNRKTRDDIWRSSGSTLRAITLSGENNAFIISDPTYTTLQDFKNYVTAEYNNGTPITVIVAVTTPTTETFTAPSIPTSGSPQSFDVDTTLKPSEVSLTYHGWHEHEDTKFTT